MTSVQIRDKIDHIINLLVVISLSSEMCTERTRPIAAIGDFVIPALRDIQDDLRDKD
jgi:hypothetical protein